MTRKWRGVCAICHVDLYSDPLLHYASQSHQDRAAAWERARWRERERERDLAGEPPAGPTPRGPRR